MMTDRAVQPTFSRRQAVVRAAAQFLLAQDVRALPVNPQALAHACGWRVSTYAKAADKLELPLSEIIETYGTRDAFTVLRKRPVIFYNDTLRSQERIRFSLCHEIGHIALGHFDCHPVDGLSGEQRLLLDREAHAFAANLLAPPAVVNALKPSHRENGAALFGLSKEAWVIRLQTFEDDLASLGESLAARQLQQFDAWMHTVRCRQCGLTQQSTVCARCGSTQMTWVPDGTPLTQDFPWREVSWRTAFSPVARPAKGGLMLEKEFDNPMLLDE